MKPIFSLSETYSGQKMKRNRIILDADDGPVNTADRADTVSGFQIIEHFLYLLVLFPLGTNQEEIKHGEENNHGQKGGHQCRHSADIYS